METNWIYTGVFLDNESRNKLMEMFGNNIPKGWKPYCHHMTLVFNNKNEESQELFNYYSQRFGQTVPLLATHIGMSDKAMAVKVKWSDKNANATPHITLATSPSGKPVDSNFIKEWIMLPSIVTLSGKINAYYKR